MKASRASVVLIVAVAGCPDNPDTFTPSARYAPTVLDFGAVAATSERTLSLTITSDGRAAVSVVNVAIEPDDDSWRSSVAAVGALAPGETSAIDVTFRACPAAWDGDELRENFDYGTCPTAPAAATLVLVDDSPDGGARIELTALPVGPPVAAVRCPVLGGGSACDMSDAELRACGQLDFGTASIGRCDLFVEVAAVAGANTNGPLVIHDVSLALTELDDPSNVVVDGETIGFTILGPDGTAIDEVTPLRIEPGATARVHVVADNVAAGTWAGIPSRDTGLILSTNDPDQRTIALTVFAQGATAQIAVTPTRLEFEPRVGIQHKQITIVSTGVAAAYLDAIEIEPAQFSWTAETEPRGLIEGPTTIDVTYDGQDDSLLTGELRLVARHETVVVPLDVTYGDRDSCAVDPSLVTFQTAGNAERSVVTVRADTAGPCRIVELDIDGSGAEDFSIDLPECSTLPCTPTPAMLMPGETFEIPVVYQNDDTSMQDIGNLRITTRDTPDAIKTVGLTATDDPCLPPTPVIMVTTESPCVNQPVQITAASSLPGGRSTGATVTTFDWIVRFGEQVVFVPPNSETTSFTPTMSRDLHVGLVLENSCGAMSTSSATQIVSVAATCP